ncbi:MAG: right-handed parallel beta-helix repeat-containing protein, partial [Burkholderiales bacterium]|nr:right-handed parallel beta-helix repeat-containing protein [Burkholderiales bacterium]
MRFAALLGAVFGKKTARHQKTSLLPCREAKHHEARHHKKIGLSVFVAAMLCMGVTAQAATITVNSAVDALTDAGKCTLRGAVDSVNAGSNQNNCVAVVSPDAYGSNDTITFDAAVFTTPTIIDVTASGEIAISKSLTIEGLLDVDDAPLITLDGKSANRILNGSGTGFVLTVSGLAFQNGRAASDYGGAIVIPIGTVTVSNSTFENNHANWGGAISARTAHVSNSTFENNQAFYFGGAIDAATAHVSNSAFENNRTDGSSSHYSHYSFGGAINATTAHVSNSTFENNQAYDGGAIYAYTANVSNSTFKGNQAYGIYDGGGGAIFGDDGTVNVSNSTFENNWANVRGGAIFAWTTLEASHLTLLDNSAGANGAAIFMYDDSSGSIHNSLILSSVALVDAPTLCAVGGAGSLGGSYNIEWVNGTDTTSCSNTNNVSGGSGAIGAIVETTLADNGGPTPTLALPAGSPAIGAADPSGATSRMLDIDFAQTPPTVTWVDATLDQRGVTRVTTAAERSLGAFEYKAPPALPAPIPVLPAPLALLLALGLAGVGFVGFRGRKTEDRGQRTEDRGQRTEDRGQR